MKMSGLNSYVLSVARALYVFVTVAAVCGSLVLLNIGGHWPVWQGNQLL